MMSTARARGVRGMLGRQGRG
eukprot:COSAG06_NODE_18559_length_881_cov_1.436061_2_plen_20_part_01